MEEHKTAHEKVIPGLSQALNEEADLSVWGMLVCGEWLEEIGQWRSG